MPHPSIPRCRPPRRLLAALLCFGLLQALPAGAQMATPEDARREIERTNEVLERARDAVQRYPDPLAAETLRLAVERQQAAIESLRSGSPGIAVRQTLEARRLAFRCLEMVRMHLGGGGHGPGDLESRAQHAIDDARGAYERAQRCAGDPPPPLARRLLDGALLRLEQAEQARRDRKYALVVDLSQQVRRLLEDVCRAAGPGSGNVAMQIETVTRLVERTAPEIESCPQASAHELLERARHLLERARDLQGSQHPVAASEHARQARELALQSLRLCEREPDARDVERLLEETERDIAVVAERVHGTGNPGAVALVERAQEHLRRAALLRARGDLRPALAEIRVARNLAWRAGRVAKLDRF